MEVKEKWLVYGDEVIIRDGICIEDCICEDCAYVDEKRILEAEKREKRKEKEERLGMND